MYCPRFSTPIKSGLIYIVLRRLSRPNVGFGMSRRLGLTPRLALIDRTSASECRGGWGCRPGSPCSTERRLRNVAAAGAVAPARLDRPNVGFGMSRRAAPAGEWSAVAPAPNARGAYSSLRLISGWRIRRKPSGFGSRKYTEKVTAFLPSGIRTSPMIFPHCPCSG